MPLFTVKYIELNISPATWKENHEIIIQRNNTLREDLWRRATKDFCEDAEL